nr:putative DVL [Ipomoea batatas]
MEYYMDEKWKLSRDDPYSHSYSSSSNPTLMRSFSQASPSTSSHPLHRSFSQKNPSSSSSSKSRFSKSSSQFTRKCSNLAKEQKAKFYIVKRCIGMLVRWNKHRDDS